MKDKNIRPMIYHYEIEKQVIAALICPGILYSKFRGESSHGNVLYVFKEKI